MSFYLQNEDQESLLCLANFFAPSSSIPIKINDGQFLSAIYSYDLNQWYFLIQNRSKFYLLLHRYNLCSFSELNKLIDFIFLTFPSCHSVQIDKSFFLCGCVNEEILGIGKSYVLALNNTIESYFTDSIDVNFKNDIARVRRNLEKNHDMKIFILTGKNFTMSVFYEVCKFLVEKLKIRNIDISNSIDLNDELLISRLYDTHLLRGGIAYITVDDDIISAALLLKSRYELSYSHAAFDEAFKKFSPSKILLLEIIKYAIENNFIYFNLGGGDYGYKKKFGAIEKTYFDTLIRRPC
jgi:hypothetical protein